MNGGDDRVLCGQSRSILAGRSSTRWPVVHRRQGREWTGAREAELPDMETRILRLEILVGERVFEDPEDGWWQRQLASLVRGIRELHDPETGLASDALAPPFGWGVARRAKFAAEIDERSVTGDEAAARWQKAIAAIAASEKYDGLTITPQMGLIPIGADAASALWEFAHLATGDPAVRSEDGTLTFNEETGLVFVLIPGGTFWMGAQKEDPDGQNYDPDAMPQESPVHRVTLSPYFLSKYEMTQGQWQRATAANPSNYVRAFGGDLRNPVEQVSWPVCMDTMAQLGLELPTEAQWENGCRAGTETPWHFGADRESLRGKINIADKTAADAGVPWTAIQDWPDHEDGGILHMPVGSYPANAFGLHGVHGNVYEWCRDGYDSGAYTADGRTDPLTPPAGSASRVFRGGSFSVTTRLARSAVRVNNAPEVRVYALGLRPSRGITTDDFTTSPVGGR